MKNNQKGFMSLALIGVVVVLVAVGGYVAWQKYYKKCCIPTGPLLKSDNTTWKTYTNTQYGFEFKYPQDLAVNFSPNSIWGVKIYDDKYIAPLGAVGQDVRTSLREVDLDIQDYSIEKLRSTQDQIDKEIKHQDDELKMKHDESIINSELEIKIYEFKTGMAGPYLKALFNNENYIFTVEAVYPHMELAKQILSTFKFTK